MSIMIIAERRYGPCRLSDDNNNINNIIKTCILIQRCFYFMKYLLLLSSIWLVASD